MPRTSEIASGNKLGFDVTKKIPGEGFKRPWPPLIKMDAAVKAKVEKLFPSWHLTWVGSKPRPHASLRSRSRRRQDLKPIFLRNLHHARDVLLLLRSQRADFLEEALEA